MFFFKPITSFELDNSTEHVRCMVIRPRGYALTEIRRANREGPATLRGGPGGRAVQGAVQIVELGEVHRLSDGYPETSSSCHRISSNPNGGLRRGWTPGSQGAIGFW